MLRKECGKQQYQVLTLGLITNLSHSIRIKFAVQIKRNRQTVLNEKDNTVAVINYLHVVVAAIQLSFCRTQLLFFFFIKCVYVYFNIFLLYNSLRIIGHTLN